jgi:hypothetical protein
MLETGRRLGGLAAALLLAIAAPGCTTEAADTDVEPAAAADPTGAFAGRVTDTDAFVAVVTDGTEVRAYVCDGTAEGASVSEWFKGQLSGGHASLTSVSEESHLTVDVTATEAVGDVTYRGGSFSFAAPGVDEGAGLFAYKRSGDDEDRTITGGWIVLDDGEQRGAVASGGRLRGSTLDGTTATMSDGSTITAGRVSDDGSLARFFTNGWP